MTEEQIRLECLKLALSGSPEATIAAADKYYAWLRQEKPKRQKTLKLNDPK